MKAQVIGIPKAADSCVDETAAMTSELRFRDIVELDYLAAAPAALAFERVVEARLYRTVPFARPVLDVGCGEGLFAKMVFADKIDSGVDPNQRELQRARELDAYGELLCCSGDSIPKPDDSYGTVFSNSVLEHIPDISPVLREVFRILKPGGRFHFTAPSANFERYTWTGRLLSLLGLSSAERQWQVFFNRFWVHYHAYDMTRWREIVSAAGFAIERSHCFAPPKTCLLNTVLTPIALPAMLTKRILNRWTLFPSARRQLLRPLWWAAEPLLRGAEAAPEGGLVFMSLRKPA